MPYPKCKIYSDRSHYIAIPHTERPYKPRRKVQEEEIVVEKGQEQGERKPLPIWKSRYMRSRNQKRKSKLFLKCRIRPRKSRLRSAE